MAATAFEVNVRHPNGQSHIINVRSDTTVEEVKRQFAERTGTDPNQFKLVFAGTTLNETSTLDTFGLMGYSTLHMIRGRSVQVSADPDNNPSIRNVENRLADVNLGQNGDQTQQPPATPPSSKKTYNQFFVYCKDVCKEMQPGKLRVRCRTCKDESFILSRGPDNWDDVLTHNKIDGTCNTQDCHGRFAEFFFKCSGHEDRLGQTNQYMALHMIRANTVDVPCASCGDTSETVVRFDCNHCMCVDCFIQYCTVNITQRSFVEKPSVGYTIECPNRCDDAHVKEIHHFQLLGKDLYERYKNFAAEEFVLQMGGVLCPAAGCGAGILLEDASRRIQCPTCRYMFCKNCKNQYHNGACAQAQPERQTPGGVQAAQFNQERLQQARWNEDSERFIRENQGVKRCPNCQVPIEKNDGCNHMSCTRCRFEFCWLCLIQWGNNCRDSHWFGGRR